MNVIYIVSGRYGVEMEEPKVFYNIKLAEKYIKQIICDCIFEDHSDEMEKDHVDATNVDEVLEWGFERDYCECYNSEFPNTYTDSNDWSEFMITKVSLPREED